MTPPKSPPGLLERLRSFDPAVLPILVAGIVLVGAVVWLLGRPLPQPAAADPRLQDQIAALRGELSRFEGLTQRVGALEARTGPDLAPLREALAAAAGRAEAVDRRVVAIEGRAGPDLAPLREEIGANAGRLAAIEERLAAAQRELASRPAVDPNAFAPRAALEALAPRSALEALAPRSALDALAPRSALEGLAPRAALDGLAQRVEALARDAAAADLQIGGRVAAAEAALAARGQAIEAGAARIGTLEQGVNARIAALEGTIAQRIAALEGQLAQRGSALEQQAARLAALEGTAGRLTALEGRASRVAAIDALRAALDAGRPLGASIRALPNPPEALARYADAAPPTEAQLRLTFEDAARVGRAAGEPQAGTGVLDSAVSRLSGLVTVRRGEEVLWGDAAAAEIERARRALEAGDLEGALRFLQRLSPPAKEAMRGWIANAEALVAARTALRQLAAG